MSNQGWGGEGAGWHQPVPPPLAPPLEAHKQMHIQIIWPI